MQLGADGINYKDLLIITQVIDGQIDLPFPVYWFNCAVNNINYSSLADCPQGVNVLANVHVRIEDYDNAIKLPNVVMDFQNDPRVAEFWDVKESDEIPDVEPLDGKPIEKDIVANDKLAKKPFCISGKMIPISLEVAEPVILTEIKLEEKNA